MGGPITYGPNEVATDEQIKERNDSIKKVTDEQLKKCEELLLTKDKKLTALVVGESGTGKSTFINTFLGKKIAEVDSGPSEVTMGVKCYTGCVGENDVTVVELPECDMNGICAHREEIKRYCPNGVDVVFVCQKMYERHRRSAIETLRRLSVIFTKEIYKKAVFVMTFANDIPRSWGRKTDERVLQEKLERDWHEQAAANRATLESELQLTHKEAKEIFVIPAGYYVNEDDPDSSRQIMGVTSDWINDSRLAAAHTAVQSSAALLEVMASDFSEDDSSSEDYSSNKGGSSISGGGGRSHSEGGSRSTGGGRSTGGHSENGGGSNDGSSSSCGIFGLMSKYLEYVGACLKNVARAVFEKLCSLVQKIASTIFRVVKGISQAVQKAFTAIYESGALQGALAGAALAGAVGTAVVVGGVTGLVIGTVIIVTLSVVLIHLFGILRGLIVLAGALGGGLAGSVVGSVIGGLVGGFFGSILPGAGTAAGAATGAQVGAWLGGGAGAVYGGAAAALS